MYLVQDIERALSIILIVIVIEDLVKIAISSQRCHFLENTSSPIVAGRSRC